MRSTGSAVARRTSSRCGHAPAEERLVGEDRDRRGAGLLVAARHVGGPEVLADGAPRGGAPLVLGDHAHLARRGPGPAERAHRGRLGHRGVRGAERPATLLRRDALPRPREDRVENGGGVADGRSCQGLPRALEQAGGPPVVASRLSPAARRSFRSFAPARDDQGGGGVQQDDVAPRPRRAARAPRGRSPRSPAASPPRSASSGALARPASSGVTVNVRTSSPSSAATDVGPASVSSSRPLGRAPPRPASSPSRCRHRATRRRRLGPEHADHLALGRRPGWSAARAG